MQVRCKFYGLVNASAGVECSVERDLLEVGEFFHCNNQDYIIVSVVESQGQWFANVMPENQRQFLRPPRAFQRLQNGLQEREALQVWRQRALQLEDKVQALHKERVHFGERLDRLMHLLEFITKESDGLGR